MTDVKRRIKTIEKQIGLDKRERVVLIRPSKFADETDEEYKARLAESDESPRDPIQADNVTIIPPAKPPIE